MDSITKTEYPGWRGISRLGKEWAAAWRMPSSASAVKNETNCFFLQFVSFLVLFGIFLYAKKDSREWNYSIAYKPPLFRSFENFFIRRLELKSSGIMMWRINSCRFVLLTTFLYAEWRFQTSWIVPLRIITAFLVPFTINLYARQGLKSGRIVM